MMCGSRRVAGSGGRAGAGRNTGCAPGPEAWFWAEGSLLHDGAQAGEGGPRGDSASTSQASKTRPVPRGGPLGPCLCSVPPGTGGRGEGHGLPARSSGRGVSAVFSLRVVSWFCRGGFSLRSSAQQRPGTLCVFRRVNISAQNTACSLVLKLGILWHAHDDTRMMAASFRLHLELIPGEEDGAV